ncbi:MAG: putative DNA-binding domain-containing protein [Bermanella sp.]
MNANLPETLLPFQKIQKSFSDAIRNPKNHPKLDGVEERRLKIYSELFFNNVEGFISGGFPVLKELFSEELWNCLVRDFFIKHSCSSPYFLQISEEFLAYLPNSTLNFLPDFTYQLAHWEWMELHADVYNSKQENFGPNILDSDTQILSLIESAWCQAYDFPVHTISTDNLPEPQTSYLMVYRNHDLDVGFNELNPLSALLFENLQNNTNQVLNSILKSIALQVDMDETTVINGGQQIINQWYELGILIELPLSRS